MLSPPVLLLLYVLSSLLLSPVAKKGIPSPLNKMELELSTDFVHNHVLSNLNASRQLVLKSSFHLQEEGEVVSLLQGELCQDGGEGGTPDWSNCWE